MMLLKSLAFAAAASAFLVIPDIPEADEAIFRTLPIDPKDAKPTEDTDEGIFRALPVDTTPSTDDGEGVFRTLPVTAHPYSVPVTALGQSIDVDCTGCHGRNSKLHFNFSVEDDTRLVLNGFELYPKADPWHGDLTAMVGSCKKSRKEQRLGYSLSMVPRDIVTDENLELIDIVLRVIEVGNRFVEGIPSVKVTLLKSIAGEILIGDISIVSAEPVCETLWCRAKSVLGGIFKMSKCSKKKAGHGAWRMSEDGRKGHKGHGKGHHEKGHHHHDGSSQRHHGKHPHQKQHSWGHLLKNIAAHIVLPVLMGITAGVSVAFIAMLFGTVVYRLALFARGRKQRSWCSRRKACRRSRQVVDDEKRVLMERDEALEDAAPYQDVVDEKTAQ